MQKGRLHAMAMTLVIEIRTERSRKHVEFASTALEDCRMTETSRCLHPAPLQPPLWHRSSPVMTRSTPLS